MKLVPAAEIEAWVWERTAEALGDRERVVQTLESACSGDGAAERYREQTASVEAQIARLAGRIDRAGDELLDVPRDSERARSLRETLAADERELVAFKVSLARLAEQAPVVLDRGEADAMLREIDLIAKGLGVAGESPEAQRTLYGLFKLTLRVGMDAGGLALGGKYRYGMSCTGLLPLSHRGQIPWGILLRWNNSQGCALTLAGQMSLPITA